MFGKKLKEENEKLKQEIENGFPVSADARRKISRWQTGHFATEHRGRSYPVYFQFEVGTGPVSANCICKECEYIAKSKAAKDKHFDRKVYADYLNNHHGIYNITGYGV